MMYSEGLKKLRKPSKTSFLEKQKAAQSDKRSSPLVPRQEESEQDQYDPIDRYREFASVLKAQAEAVRGKNEAQVQKLVRELGPKSRTKQAVEEPAEKEQETSKSKRVEERERRRKESPVASMGNMSVSARNWLEIMDKTEGGGNYSTLFGHSQSAGGRFSGVDVSRMTLGELKQFSRPDGPYAQWVSGQVGRVATPMGRYQFVGSTLDAVAKEMGLPDDTVFSREVQDAMFEHYLKKRISQGSTMLEKVEQVRQAWEGFRSVPTEELAKLIRNTYETGYA